LLKTSDGEKVFQAVREHVYALKSEDKIYSRFLIRNNTKKKIVE